MSNNEISWRLRDLAADDYQTPYEREALNLAADVLDAIPDKDDPVGWVQRLAVMMDQQHILVLGPDGWSIEHPITCRLDGQAPLHECPHHIAVVEHVDMVLDEWGEGSYRIWLDDTIWCGFDGTPT